MTSQEKLRLGEIRVQEQADFSKVDDVWGLVSNLRRREVWSGYGNIEVGSSQEQVIELGALVADLESVSASARSGCYPGGNTMDMRPTLPNDRTGN